MVIAVPLRPEVIVRKSTRSHTSVATTEGGPMRHLDVMGAAHVSVVDKADVAGPKATILEAMSDEWRTQQRSPGLSFAPIDAVHAGQQVPGLRRGQPGSEGPFLGGADSGTMGELRTR
jgi:hypothetical protein